MNLSRILTCFHLASGLKVNFNKSKLYGVGVCNVELNSLASIVGCIAAQFPCTYLGLPIGASMSKYHHWTPLVDSLGVYYFSTYKAPKKIINKLESIRRNFFWAVQWTTTRFLGLFGKKFSPLEIMGDLVIRSIYGSSGCLNVNATIRSNLGVWYQIVKLRNDLLKVNINLPSIFKIKLGNGQSTSFWHDSWIGGSPLEDSFPRLYRLDTNPNCNVFDRKLTDIVHVSSDHLVSFGPEDTTFPLGLLFQWPWREEPSTTPELEALANLFLCSGGRFHAAALDFLPPHHSPIIGTDCQVVRCKTSWLASLIVSRKVNQPLGEVKLVEGVHGVHVQSVWFEVELQGAQGNCEAEVFKDSNDDVVVAQRKLEVRQLEKKTNTDSSVKEQKRVHFGIKVGQTLW
ncbi:hypothetical protein Tco_0331053 [Tanacetum coccineum]